MQNHIHALLQTLKANGDMNANADTVAKLVASARGGLKQVSPGQSAAPPWVSEPTSHPST
jgi:hypothetical protein